MVEQHAIKIDSDIWEVGCFVAIGLIVAAMIVGGSIEKCFKPTKPETSEPAQEVTPEKEPHP